MEDDDVTGAIDTGESYTPPDEQAAAAPQAAAPQQASAGLPDVGEAPFAAREGRTPMRRGMAEMGSAAAEGLGRSVENVKNSVPGQLTKRIVSYLMGADAGAPHMIDETAAQVDPRKEMPASDRNLFAVQQVAERQGPEAAWKLVQANRVAYNAKQAFAYTAMNGTQQKPPDMNAAIDAANQAQSHVLDGSDVQFAQSRTGVTATVKGPDGQPQVMELSRDAFREYLNVGRNGQYDRVMQDTVPGTLKRLSAGGRTRITPTPPKAPQAKAPPVDNSESDAYTPEIPKTNFGTTRSTMNLSGSDEVQNRGPGAVEARNYGDELEARAQSMFPGITQEAQRNQWMAQQEQQGAVLKNKVDVEETKGKYGTSKAEIKADADVEKEGIRASASTENTKIKLKGWMYATDGKQATAQIKADQQKAHDGDKAAQARIESARKMIAVKEQTAQSLTPEEKELQKMMTQGGMAAASGQQQAPSRPQQQAPAQRPAASPGQPPVQGAKYFNGSWYTRGPNGESVPVK